MTCLFRLYIANYGRDFQDGRAGSVAPIFCSFSLAAHEPIPVPVYQDKVREIIGKVPEFRWLAELAKKYDLQVWLFGGSAASFAHYVKENILLEQGSDEFYEESFSESSKGERHYTDIFRPTQDIDLVVDGMMERVTAFERGGIAKIPGYAR